MHNNSTQKTLTRSRHSKIKGRLLLAGATECNRPTSTQQGTSETVFQIETRREETY